MISLIILIAIILIGIIAYYTQRPRQPKPTDIEVLTPQKLRVICPRGFAPYKFGNVCVVALNEHSAKRIFARLITKKIMDADK